MQLPASHSDLTSDDEPELGIVLVWAGCFDDPEFKLAWPLPDTHKQIRDRIGARLQGSKNDEFLQDSWDVEAKPQQGLLKPVVKDAYKLQVLDPHNRCQESLPSITSVWESYKRRQCYNDDITCLIHAAGGDFTVTVHDGELVGEPSRHFAQGDICAFSARCGYPCFGGRRLGDKGSIYSRNLCTALLIQVRSMR